MAIYKDKKAMAEKFTEAELRQFTGTDLWHRHGLVRSVLYTDGVQYMAEKADAYWLLDIIATESVALRTLKDEAFQVWHLVRDAEGNGATLTVDDGGKGVPSKVLHTRRIEYTDFPLDEITLYCTENNDPSVGVKRIIQLPSEY